MTLWHRFTSWIAARTATFDSPPKPIDRLFAEMYRTTGTSVGRAEALSVPAVQRGRNMLCSIATLPLEQLDPKNKQVDNPLLRQIDPDIPNVVTLSQTIEDLIFESTSYWQVTASDFDGFPTSARHVDFHSVTFRPPGDHQMPAPLPSGQDPRGSVPYINGRESSWAELKRFDSPNPGMLQHGGRAIRRAILLDKAAAMYADDPRPLDYFSPAEGADQIDDDDVRALLAQWRTARKQRGTAYVPAALKYNSVDSPSPADLQLVELQKQVMLELANMFGIDPEDLGVSTTSRTYQNDVDRRRNRINDVYSPYMRAITDRLSMGDVTRRGHRVQFKLDDFLKSNPTERANVQKTYLDMGVLTVDEIREEEGLPPLPAGPAPEPAQPPADAVQASSRPRVMFAAKPISFDAEVTAFAVDGESRTITGMLMPYNAWGSNGGVRYRFAKGSLKFSDPGRVKLLRDHNPASAIGYAKSFKDTPSGLMATFKVANGAAGDEALALAQDGVLDGLSAGVEFDGRTDVVNDPKDRTAFLVTSAALREGSLTALPAFDDARLTSVQASLAMEGTPMEECSTCGQQHAPGVACSAPQPQTTPAQIPVTFTAEQVTAMIAGYRHPQPVLVAAPAAESERPQVVDPTRSTAATFVREALPYRFDRGGNFLPTEHVFSADLLEMSRAKDLYGDQTAAGKRVMGLMQATFDVDSLDVPALNPAIQRPEMYVDQRDFKYPLWEAVTKGAPPNGIQPFTFPKFSSASGLVGDHTQATEPTSGTFVATSQTVTPTPISGKASITREVWDMGGNPAVSTLIFNQMVRGYREGLESATATFLNTLTAATDINLNTGATAGQPPTDAQLSDTWENELAGLQFVRGYDFSVFALEVLAYKHFARAKDGNGRRLYPIHNPMNANGSASSRFQTLDLAGVIGVPSWALPSVGGSPNNSWLFDPSVVFGWATSPQRLEFPGTNTTGGYAPVAEIDIAIWGYKAFANTDIGGVRQVTYDTTT